MLETTILGFLAEGPLHGYELRRRVARLSGHARPVSDGSLYPAIKRLVAAGFIERHLEGGGGPTRHVLTLTRAGLTYLVDSLRDPAESEITDFARFSTILAFLSLVPAAADREAVLRRRLRFLQEPASFFYSEDCPLRAEEITDPYRRGLLLIARSSSQAEREWLDSVLSSPNDDRSTGEDSAALG